jgi:hypothetical protein
MRNRLVRERVGFLAGPSTADTAEMMSLHHIAMTALTAWMVILGGLMMYMLVAA